MQYFLAESDENFAMSMKHLMNERKYGIFSNFDNALKLKKIENS